MARTIVISVKIENKGAIASLNRLEKAQEKQKAATKRQSEQFRKLRKDINDVANGKRRLTHLQGGLTKSFIKGNLASRAITLGINSMIRAVRAAAVAVKEFEFNVAKTAAVTGLSSDKINELSRNLRDIAVNTIKTASEVSNAAFEMSKLGLSADEVSDSVKSVIDLSTVLGEDITDTGQTVVQVLNAYSLSADNATKVTDLLAGSFSKSALDLNAFRTAFSHVGGVAKTTGVSLNELGAAMGVLRNAGIRASTVGTQLRQILVRLSNANSKAGQIIGHTSVEAIGLTEALRRLSKQSLSTQEVKEAFGIRALPLIRVLQNSTHEFENLSESLKNSEGSLDEMSEKIEGTYTVEVGKLASAWEEFGLSLNDVVGEEVKKTIRFLTTLTKVVSFLLKQLDKFQEANKEEERQRGGKEIGFSNTAIPLATRNSGRSSAVAEDEAVKQTRDVTQYINDLANATTESIEESYAKAQSEVAAFNAENDRLISRLEKIKENYQVSQVFGTPEEYSAIAEEAAKIGENLLNRGETDAAIEAKTFSNQLVEQQLDMEEEVLENEFKILELEVRRTEELKKQNEEYYELLDSLLESIDRSEKIADNIFKNFEVNKITDEMRSIGFVLQNVAHAANLAADAIAFNLVEAFSTGKKEFVSFKDVFAQIIQKLISDVISFLIRLVILKGILAAFGPTGGPGAFAVAGGATSGLNGFAKLFVQQGLNFQASGTDQVVRKPTLFVAGESGAERVKVTPRSKMNQEGESGSGLVININGDIYGEERFMRAVKIAEQRIGQRYV